MVNLYLGGKRRAWVVFAALTIIFPCFALGSPVPTVTIQLLDGRNGKPMNKARFVILFPDEKGRPGLVLRTNQKGEVEFDAQGSGAIIVTPVSAVDCGAQEPGGPKPSFSVAEILNHGIVTKNTCGDLHIEPQRGRLLYFARRIHFWEGMKG
jgi:hypothetical protein